MDSHHHIVANFHSLSHVLELLAHRLPARLCNTGRLFALCARAD